MVGHQVEYTVFANRAYMLDTVVNGHFLSDHTVTGNTIGVSVVELTDDGLTHNVERGTITLANPSGDNRVVVVTFGHLPLWVAVKVHPARVGLDESQRRELVGQLFATHVQSLPATIG